MTQVAAEWCDKPVCLTACILEQSNYHRYEGNGEPHVEKIFRGPGKTDAVLDSKCRQGLSGIAYVTNAIRGDPKEIYVSQYGVHVTLEIL